MPPRPSPRPEPPASARGSFLRVMSHELRTPLNSIIGFSELIGCELYGPLGAPQYKEYADIIHSSGHRLLKLVNQIVEVMRLEEGAMELEIAPQGLDEALNDAIGGLAAEAAARRVGIEAAARLPAVKADAKGLRTVLAALLQNAIAHSPEGGVVQVRARQRAGRVEIEIEDRGCGIELEDIPRLMRPFEQGGSALTRAGEGVGLGLTIVRLLSEAMGGGLRLDSRPGQGLTAIVALPAPGGRRLMDVAAARQPA